MKEYPSKEELNELFTYNKDNGLLNWRYKKKGRKFYSIIGSVMIPNGPNRYRVIGINNKSYFAHKLIWIYHHGAIEKGIVVDHIDGDGLNNRMNNLRLSSMSMNARNRRLSNRNTTKHCGVYRQRGDGDYTAAICVNYKQIYLGYFHNIEDAIKARKKAEIKYNFDPSHGTIKAN